MRNSRYYTYPLAALVALSFLLGMFGLMQYYDNLGLPYHWLDILYGCIQLFPLNSGGLEAGNIPLSLHVARFMAPLATVWAIVMGAAYMGKSLLDYLWLKDHVVVCGFGYYGEPMVRHYRKQNKRVVVVDNNAEEVLQARVQACGATLFRGDATDKAFYKKIKLEHAGRLAIACGDDGKNLVAMTAADKYLKERGRTRKLSCHLFTSTLRSEAVTTMLNALLATGSRLDVHPINPDMATAFNLLDAHPLDFQDMGKDSPLRVQLVLANWTHFAEVLAIATAHMAHYANGTNARITLLDAPPEMESVFQARYPHAEKAATFCFVSHPAESLESIAVLRQELDRPNTLTTVVLCSDDMTQVLNQALTLPVELDTNRHQLLARLSGACTAPFIDILQTQETSTKLRFKIVNALPDDLGIMLEIDALAKVIHDTYYTEQNAKGNTKPAVCLWDDLPQNFKQSSRLAALHHSVKIRGARCEVRLVTPVTVSPNTNEVFSADEIETLAATEHARWMAEKHMEGWQYAAQRDDAARKHPDLIPWDRLDDAAKQKDRIIVQGIPNLLQLQGNILCRKDV